MCELFQVILFRNNLFFTETQVSISVPKADRRDRPVFLGENPLTGTYRRNGEGDYRCTREEVQMMIRDQSERSQDMLVLDEMELDVFDYPHP